MSTARHHAEWLSLVEVSGPFLSMPVLMRVFPQGLLAHEPNLHRNLRLAHEEWEENLEGGRPDRAVHQAWVKFVLKDVLELGDEVIAEGQAIQQTLQTIVPEHNETLRPDLVVVNPPGRPDAGKPRLLVQVYPASQNLEKPVSGRTWKASPDTRMMELLHDTDVRLGLVTNGEQWMLVDAPRNETTGYRLVVCHALAGRADHPAGVSQPAGRASGSLALPITRRWKRCWPRAPRTSRKSPTSLAIRSARPSRC